MNNYRFFKGRKKTMKADEIKSITMEDIRKMTSDDLKVMLGIYGRYINQQAKAIENFERKNFVPSQERPVYDPLHSRNDMIRERAKSGIAIQTDIDKITDKKNGTPLIQKANRYSTLLHEVSKANRYLRFKTSTLEGVKESRKSAKDFWESKFYESTGKKVKLTNEQLKVMWEIVDLFRAFNPQWESYELGSDDIMNNMADITSQQTDIFNHVFEVNPDMVVFYLSENLDRYRDRYNERISRADILDNPELGGTLKNEIWTEIRKEGIQLPNMLDW